MDSTATNITTYQWNNANQLTAVRVHQLLDLPVGHDTSEVDYGYDAFGRMVSRTPRRGTAQYYVYDGQNMALVLNAGGQVLERELYGAGRSIRSWPPKTVTPVSPDRRRPAR